METTRKWNEGRLKVRREDQVARAIGIMEIEGGRRKKD